MKYSDIEVLKKLFNTEAEKLSGIPDKAVRLNGFGMLKNKIITALVGIGLTFNTATATFQSWEGNDSIKQQPVRVDSLRGKKTTVSAEISLGKVNESFKAELRSYIAFKGIFDNIHIGAVGLYKSFFISNQTASAHFIGDPKILKDGFVDYLTSAGVKDIETAKSLDIEKLWDVYHKTQIAFQNLHANGDMKVLERFAPLAKKMMDDDLPPLEEGGKGRKLSKDELFAQLEPLLESVFSSKEYKIIRDQKGRTDISKEATVAMTDLLTQKTSPKINRLLNEMLNNEKIHFNRTEEVFEPNQEYQTLYEQLYPLRQEYEVLLKSGGSRERLAKVYILIKEYETKMALISSKNVELMPSKYIRKEKSINVKMDYTQEDVLTLAHELGHAVTPEINSRMCEIPSILFEFFTDRFMSRHNLGSLRPDTTRIKEMHGIKTDIYAMHELFKSFDSNGVLTPAAIKNYKSLMGGWESTERSDKEDSLRANLSNYSLDIIDYVEVPLIKSRYFIGSASAFSILERIKSKEDMDSVLTIINRRDIGDWTKLDMLGVTSENVINATGRVITRNRTDLKKQGGKEK